MKPIFVGSHKTIEECSIVISLKVHKILIINLSQWIYIKIGICAPYTLLSQLCEFHKDQISGLDVLTD